MEDNGKLILWGTLVVILLIIIGIINPFLRGSKLNCVIVLFFLLASKISFHIEFIFRYLSESKIMVYLID